MTNESIRKRTSSQTGAGVARCAARGDAAETCRAARAREADLTGVLGVLSRLSDTIRRAARPVVAAGVVVARPNGCLARASVVGGFLVGATVLRTGEI